MVKELREETKVGMMECKKALQESGGDKAAAVKLLRERGVVIAGKKASRKASEGMIDAAILDEGKAGVMIEVNCETDFVTRNDTFKDFVKYLLEKAKTTGDNELAEVEKDALVAKVAEIGENLVIGRNIRFEVENEGLVASYIHLGGKVGVLVELSLEKAETAGKELVKELAKDLTLHIAASAPQYLDSSEVPQDVIDAERAIYAKQMEDKPANILDKIIEGKINKFYSQICFVDQGFVKDPDQKIVDLVASVGKQVDDTIVIKRYARFQIG
jgi:elongation factor Ts